MTPGKRVNSRYIVDCPACLGTGRTVRPDSTVLHGCRLCWERGVVSVIVAERWRTRQIASGSVTQSAVHVDRARVSSPTAGTDVIPAPADRGGPSPAPATAAARPTAQEPGDELIGALLAVSSEPHEPAEIAERQELQQRFARLLDAQVPDRQGEGHTVHVLLSKAQAAAMLGVDEKVVARWVKTGKLTSVRTRGARRRFRQADVKALLPQPPWENNGSQWE